jgi:hypothetical protein
MEPLYFVLARGPKTGITVHIPIYPDDNLDKTVKESAQATAQHLRNHGWTGVKVLAG